MLFDEIIVEKSAQEFGKSAEMQAGFQQIAHWLIDAWIGRIMKYGDPAGDINRIAGSAQETFQHGKHLRKLPEPLRVFAKNIAKRSMILQATIRTGGTKGQYLSNPGGQPIIRLYFDQDAVDDVEGQSRNSWKIHNFLSTRKDTLVHELIHAYDDFASEGKYSAGAIPYIRPYRSGPPTDDEKIAAHNRYLQFPHEINARFGQTVAILNTHHYAKWQDYVYQFKDTFVGWHLMSPEIKRRLLVRLGMLWTAEQKQQAIDINPYINKLNDRLRQTYDVWISPAHGNIEVDDLDRVPYRAQVTILDAVCRLADIFQRQVVTSDALPILRDFGFVANKGRNKDYRISRRFLRPARKRDLAGALKAT